MVRSISRNPRFREILAFVLLGVLPAPASAIPAIPTHEIYTDATMTTPGLVGSYVNQSLQFYAAQNDWRVTQVVSGTRVDATIQFTLNESWGARAPLGLTSGTDTNWELFAVQWDGWIKILDDGVQLATESDDASRMWVDVNHDGAFSPLPAEFTDNHWGSGQATTLGPLSARLAAGLYRIRIQYNEIGGGNYMRLAGFPPPMVRFAYIIPSNRAPQSKGVFAIQQSVLLIRDWYREQMDRLGFGWKTFRYETEPDGATPKVHVVPVTATDAQLRSDPWPQVGTAAGAAGVPLWSTGQLWVLVPEMHLQQPDGSVSGGGLALGAGGGSGSDAGVAMIGSEKLSLFPEGLISNLPYDGRIEPSLGPYPLVQNASFPWFEGNTIGSIMSCYLGAFAHEMTHGFGAPHDVRNDDNFLGNLMGNGLRGIRGSVLPNLYPNEDTQLTMGLGAALARSPYFVETPFTLSPLAIASQGAGASTAEPRPVIRPPGGAPLEPDFAGNTSASAWDPLMPPAAVRTVDQAAAPSASLLTSGTVTPVAGLLHVAFTASGTNALAEAWLLRNGQLIDEKTLSGTSVSSSFDTPWYTAGQNDTYGLVIFDSEGLRGTASAAITPATGQNHAPLPGFHATPSSVTSGGYVLLDTWPANDPEGSSLLVEWDLDDNGTFDTAPTSARSLSTTLPPGTRRVRARLTDSSGRASISAPIALRVLPSTTAVEDAPVGARLAVGPNPVSAATRVRFSLAQPGATDLSIYDLQGRRVAAPVRGEWLAAGPHEIALPLTRPSGLGLSSGVYFCVLRSGSSHATARFVIAR